MTQPQDLERRILRILTQYRKVAKPWNSGSGWNSDREYKEWLAKIQPIDQAWNDLLFGEANDTVTFRAIDAFVRTQCEEEPEVLQLTLLGFHNCAYGYGWRWDLPEGHEYV